MGEEAKPVKVVRQNADDGIDAADASAWQMKDVMNWLKISRNLSFDQLQILTGMQKNYLLNELRLLEVRGEIRRVNRGWRIDYIRSWEHKDFINTLHGTVLPQMKAEVQVLPK